ncbi:MAG: hypothetical protein RIT35_1218 [Pseudomonadota bacterium]|jgi:magnesium transporter
MPKNDKNSDITTYGVSSSDIVAINHALDNDDVQVASTLLSALHYADIADLIEDATLDNKRKILNILQDSFNPEILVELNTSIRLTVIDLLGAETSANLIAQLEPSEALFALEDLTEAKQQEILEFIPGSLKALIIEGLAYPENSAGRVMQKRVISVPSYFTVGQTIEYLRGNEYLADDFYEIFAVDNKHHPVGGVLVSRLIKNQLSMPIKQIMSGDIKIISTYLDQEEISFLFKQYMLSSAPVVNKKGRLVGVISMDDILDITYEEAEEDIMHMGGVTETDIHSQVLTTAKLRLPWLIVNLCTACLTAMVINMFQGTIEYLITLAALMPIVASMGGNAGTQTATVAVRAIANKQINSLNYKRVITKQIIVSCLNGTCLAVISGIGLMLWYNNLQLSLVFSMAVIINFTLAGFFGSIIPIALNKIGVDPAISSSIFLTALTDAIGFFSFLALATLYC